MAGDKKSPFLTTGERVRNFIAWAFVLSLLVHTIVIFFFPNLGNNEQEQQVEKVTVTKRIKIHVPTPPPRTPTPPPTPPPPPHPTPAPPQKPQPKLAVHVPKTHNSTNTNTTEQKYTQPKGTEQGVPSGEGTASPGPPATPGPPACKVPFQDATATDQVPPDYPESAKELGIGDVTVLVEVTVGPTGSLDSASIYKSSINMDIDRNALRAARESRYSPKIVNCEPVSGTYLFRADFTTE
jgi:TonB family protein